MVLVLTLLISIVSLVMALVVLFAARSFGSRQLTPRPEVRALPMSEPTLFRIRQLLGERRKIQAIKELRDSQPGLGLKEAKELVEAAPKPVKEAVSKEEAEAARTKLVDAGATADIK